MDVCPRKSDRRLEISAMSMATEKGKEVIGYCKKDSIYNDMLLYIVILIQSQTRPVGLRSISVLTVEF
ncbi:hypothetical protein NMY3_01064 [Candidatus Nitrosocosmicus oleophilus]|uniref:Uncharacterized protein n=1 Tax=Candidatus Nitrosocosmicus oleophilus TaxID=1353260 RepID=A0A654LYF8_9ARCH|nr:hypothetical protein NMY3_01064 [Candidatus Nitrosocosmicus oleophilus]